MSGLRSRYILYRELDEGEIPEEATNRPTTYEAKRYHDYLEEMLQDEGFLHHIPMDMAEAMSLVHDVLCWTLGHDNNGDMGHNMTKWAKMHKNYLHVKDDFDN